MSNCRSLLTAAAAIAFSLVVPMAAHAAEPTKVVATFSVIGDMAQRLGGDHITLTTLVGANGDAHVYQPTPKDARAVSEADVLIVNGLEFEGWLERLAEAAAFKGGLVVATAGTDVISLEDDHDGEHGDDHGVEEEEHQDERHAESEAKDDDHEDEEHAGHDHGAFDPHAWHNLKNGVVYVDNITAALAKADPANATTFYQNRAAYVAEMEALDAEIIALVENLPADRRTVVTPHDAFGYFSKAYGVTFLAPQGLSTEAEASAGDVARLITQIREEGISAVFMENVADGRLLEQVVAETGANIGGTLYSDALSGADEPASTYLDMMRHNATTVALALGS